MNTQGYCGIQDIAISGASFTATIYLFFINYSNIYFSNSDEKIHLSAHFVKISSSGLQKEVSNIC